MSHIIRLHPLGVVRSHFITLSTHRTVNWTLCGMNTFPSISVNQLIRRTNTTISIITSLQTLHQRIVTSSLAAWTRSNHLSPDWTGC